MADRYTPEVRRPGLVILGFLDHVDQAVPRPEVIDAVTDETVSSLSNRRVTAAVRTLGRYGAIYHDPELDTLELSHLGRVWLLRGYRPPLPLRDPYRWLALGVFAAHRRHHPAPQEDQHP